MVSLSRPAPSKHRPAHLRPDAHEAVHLLGLRLPVYGPFRPSRRAFAVGTASLPLCVDRPFARCLLGLAIPPKQSSARLGGRE